jgi:tripartite ATP-independent transporter DctP family solute receptor
MRRDVKLIRPRSARRSVAVAALVPLVLGVAACGGSSNGAEPGNKTFTFQFGINDPEGEWDTIAFQKWAANVKKDTDGHVVIKTVTNGALGKNSTQLAAIEKGSQFGYSASEGDLEGLDPIFTIPDLPYVFPGGVQQVKKILDGEFGEKLNAAAQKHGLRCVGWITFGPRDIMSKTPVRSPKDLNGLKLRVQPSKTMQSGYKKLGADINPIAYNEVYTAISTGVVDAMENAPTQLYAKKIYQVAKNLTLNDMIQSVGCLMVSNQLFQALPTEYQQTISKDGAAASVEEFDGFEAANNEAIDAMKKAGVTVYQADPAEWKAAVGTTAEDFAKAQGPEVYDAYKKILADESGS